MIRHAAIHRRRRFRRHCSRPFRRPSRRCCHPCHRRFRLFRHHYRPCHRRCFHRNRCRRCRSCRLRCCLPFHHRFHFHPSRPCRRRSRPFRLCLTSRRVPTCHLIRPCRPSGRLRHPCLRTGHGHRSRQRPSHCLPATHEMTRRMNLLTSRLMNHPTIRAASLTSPACFRRHRDCRRSCHDSCSGPPWQYPPAYFDCVLHVRRNGLPHHRLRRQWQRMCQGAF